MTGDQKRVVVSGSFDDIRSQGIRFLEEASKLGPVTCLLWTDRACSTLNGKAPKFPEAERMYFLRNLRYVTDVKLIEAEGLHTLPSSELGSTKCWVVDPSQDHPDKKKFCAANQIGYHAIREEELKGFPEQPPRPTPGRKKVIVTGCYDWFHSGHVRFFEEVSAHGDVYVVVGHDANIRLLKGEGHPLIPDSERRYVCGSVRFVTQALVSSGDGWLDAEPEIKRIKPDIYAVNEDGDKGGKREYCAKIGIEYLVLKRTPAPGLPKRSSTDLRGF
jgi:cytidyltransferase-like protein